MSTRAVWVDAGNDPDYAKLAHYGITRPDFDPRDPRVTASYLTAVLSHPAVKSCGLYVAWSWYPVGTTPAQLARIADEYLRRIAWKGHAHVTVDIEKGHGIDDATFVPYLVDFAAEWRTLRPTRRTTLTFEGMQGGLFDPDSVDALVAENVLLAPQMYAGNMVPLPHDVTIDLLMAGFPGERIVGMYDGADLPYRWRGVAFTQGRLP